MKLVHHSLSPASETRDNARRRSEDPMYAQASGVTDAIREAAYEGRDGLVGFGELHPAIEEVLVELGYEVTHFDVPNFGRQYLISWRKQN